jgi:hypothetical protein
MIYCLSKDFHETKRLILVRDLKQFKEENKELIDKINDFIENEKYVFARQYAVDLSANLYFFIQKNINDKDNYY